jgi:HEAT repeat protein
MKRAFLAFLVTLSATACARAPMAPNDAAVSLRSPDAAVRERAADDLRRDEQHGVPLAAAPALLDALRSEPDLEVRGAILVTLGRSGTPEAKDAIEDALASDPDPGVHRAAERALHYWKVQNDDSDKSWSYWVPGWRPDSKLGN